MADAITTRNPVNNTQFIVNKYEDINGKRVSQQTPRGRLCFLDADNRMTLPRDPQEASKSVEPVDWPKPLNPPPYFDGPGLNGTGPYAFGDGSLNSQETLAVLDPDVAFQTPWPVGYRMFDVPPYFYNLPVTSGNKALVFSNGGIFTYASGNYVGQIEDYGYGDLLYASYDAGVEGMVTNVAPSGVTNVVGHVYERETFGPGTLTMKLKGHLG